jgi:hypothetical protein
MIHQYLNKIEINPINIKHFETFFKACNQWLRKLFKHELNIVYALSKHYLTNFMLSHQFIIIIHELLWEVLLTFFYLVHTLVRKHLHVCSPKWVSPCVMQIDGMELMQ